MKKRLLILFISIVIVFSFAGTISAQIRETGQIQGSVKDEQGDFVPGATVTLSGPHLYGGVHSSVTDHGGSYRFPSLPGGSYTVSVEMPGFAKVVRENILLNANKTLVVDFKLERAKFKEEIVVIGRTPTIDVKSSAPGGVVLTDEFLLNVPYIKNVLAAIHMAPGIDSDNQSAYGSGTAVDNAWMIDGVNVTTTYQGGLHFRPDFNIIKEAAVRGLGLPAEYGEYTGAVINIITKSGSNKFSGLAEFNLHGKNWNSQNTGSIPANRFYNPVQKSEEFNTGDSLELGFQMGGRILRDKLWFFAAGSYGRGRSYLRGLDYHETWHDPKIFGKLDYQVNNANRVQFSFIWQKDSTDNYGMSFSIPEEIAQIARDPRYSISGAWTSLFSPNTVLDVKFGYYYQETNTLPHPGLENVPAKVDIAANLYYDNVQYFRKADDSRIHLTAHLSHYVSDFLGSHDIKIGGEFQHGKYGKINGAPGGAVYYYAMGNPLFGYKQEPIYRDYYVRTFAAFAQDSWTIGRKLTLNYGLRLNSYWFKNPAPDLGVLYKSAALAPRFGLAYDVVGDHKNIIKLHYGHYYSALNVEGLDSIETRATPLIRLIWNGSEWTELSSTIEKTVGWSVDSEAKHPYIEEFVAGYERELFKNASLEINAYYRKAKRFMGAVLMNGNFILTESVNPGPDGVTGTADDSTIPYYEVDYANYQQPIWSITNVKEGLTPYILDNPRRVQKGVEFIFNKRLSNRWQLLLSYAYGISRGNTNQLWTSLGSNPNYYSFANGKMFYYGEPHHFRIQGSVLLPWDVQVGFTGSYMSGTYEQTLAYCMTPSGGIALLKVRAVGDGTRADARKDFNLRLEKQFRFGGSKMMTVMANIENVFNFHGVLMNDYYYGPTYGKIVYLQNPRVFSVAARFWF